MLQGNMHRKRGVGQPGYLKNIKVRNKDKTHAATRICWDNSWLFVDGGYLLKSIDYTYHRIHEYTSDATTTQNETTCPAPPKNELEKRTWTARVYARQGGPAKIW
jgi:hypothetical protein